ncbi:hypothetical protein J6590_005443 [Homalodisca vitripennis]|nr:hypothetical protein J6590_005443 [Homalodisca vitripennis]
MDCKFRNSLPFIGRNAYYEVWACCVGRILCWKPEHMLILQKNAIRILTDFEPQHSCRKTFLTRSILTVTALYIQEVILHVHSLILQTGKDFHSYNTRHATNFILPSHCTAIFEGKPSSIGRKLWHVPPGTIRGLKRSTLEKRMNDLLVNWPFYSLYKSSTPVTENGDCKIHLTPTGISGVIRT